MAYTVPPLPYPFDALEPYIDAKTMEIHHDKHHAAYVKNLNDALEGTGLGDQPVEAPIAKLDSVPEKVRIKVRNNGGGHANHSLVWTVMGKGKGGQPSGKLADAINGDLGGFAKFTEAFTAAATTRFGGGWAWLFLDHKTGKLAVGSLPNQDSPIMEGNTPLLGIDVWEHAYYLKYQNRRPEYIAAFYNVIDWDAVGQRFAAAKK